MIYELIKTGLIFKVLEMAQVLFVKRQREEKFDTTTLLWALFSIGSAWRTIPARVVAASRSVPLLVKANLPLASVTEEDEEEASFESICKCSDTELPSITEEEEEDFLDDTHHTSVVIEIEDSSSSATPPRRKKHVAFSSADIHVFSMTVGDNPSVHSGPPVSLDYRSPCRRFENVPLEQVSTTSNSVTNHEESRTQRKHGVPRISAEQRQRILQDNGLSNSLISKAEKSAAAARKARRSTLSKMDKQRHQERRESVREFFFPCKSSKGAVEMYEPFLSTPHDLSSTRNGDTVCRACAKKCLDDTGETTLAMYRCKGGQHCAAANAESSSSSSLALPAKKGLSVSLRRRSRKQKPNTINACTA